MSRLILLPAAVLAFAFAVRNDAVEQRAGNLPRTADLSASSEAGTDRQYGTPQKLGNGEIRTYVVLDEKNGGAPLEIGVAMSEDAMEGLPAPLAPGEHKGKHKGHEMVNMFMYILDIPAENPTPYKFVQFDWNPVGHEPPGIYDLPHFDFHFYTVTDEVRRSILPSDPQFAQKAAAFPAAQFRPQFYVDGATLAGAPTAMATVPEMGLHWLDVRSSELQKAAGKPDAWKPFSKTFIWGTWNGQFIFHEPMITRAYIMAKRNATDPAVRDEFIPIPTAASYSPAGFYPAAYRIMYDANAKEYRISLTQFAQRN